MWGDFSMGIRISAGVLRNDISFSWFCNCGDEIILQKKHGPKGVHPPQILRFLIWMTFGGGGGCGNIQVLLKEHIKLNCVGRLLCQEWIE